MAEPKFPPWALITLLSAIAIASIFLGLLLRRLRLVHTEIWERLGRPTLFVWPVGKSFLALLDAIEAYFRLLIFPFRAQSFQLDDPGTAFLLWFVRINLALVWALGFWSWWANR